MSRFTMFFLGFMNLTVHKFSMDFILKQVYIVLLDFIWHPVRKLHFCFILHVTHNLYMGFNLLTVRNYSFDFIYKSDSHINVGFRENFGSYHASIVQSMEGWQAVLTT